MKRAILLMLVGLLWAGSVSAATMVTTWAFTNTASFVNATDTKGKSVGEAGAEVFINDDGTILSWGEPSSTLGNGQRSSLELETPVTGSLTTNGEAESAVSITHYNYIISSTTASLASGIVEVSLALTPLDPVGAALETFVATLEFMFVETLNSSDTPGDIFVLADASTLSKSFDYNGYTYTFTFTGEAFSEITGAYDEYLDELLGEGTYYGWVTQELSENLGQFYVQITAVPIATPEPQTLFLLGLGLIGLGMMVRHRRN